MSYTRFNLFFIFLLFYTFLLKAQKTGNDSSKSSREFGIEKPKGVFVKMKPVHFSSGWKEELKNYFENTLPAFSGSENVHLGLLNFIESPAGYHLTFVQLIDSIAIYNSQLKVNLNKNLVIRSFFDNTFPVIIHETIFPDKAIADAYLQNKYHLKNLSESPAHNEILSANSRIVYFPVMRENETGNPDAPNGTDPVLIELIPAIAITVHDANINNYEVVLGTDGGELFYNDLNRYFNRNSKFEIRSRVLGTKQIQNTNSTISKVRASLKTKKFEAGETERSPDTLCRDEHFEVSARGGSASGGEAQRRNSKFLEMPSKVNSAAGQSAIVDTIVTAMVFLPDPLTTAQVSYGGVYIDSNDADIVELNSQRQLVSMKVAIINDTFRLQSQWVKIEELFSSPTIYPAYSTTPSFIFTRNQDQFEDVNVFYHISEYKKHIETVGFPNLPNFLVHADAHALGGEDNSLYSGGSLFFGEGCVDDAEDADVIIHEYGHAIQESAAPGTLIGLERYAIEEGNSDYFASSYSRKISEFAWDQVFTWDGHNTCWDGRTTKSLKYYPTDLSPSDKYVSAPIWSSTLMQVWEDIGGNTTDMLLFQSLYSYAANMTMIDAAKLLLQADTDLFAAVHAGNIFLRFNNRGITGISETQKRRETPPLFNNPVHDLLELKFSEEISAQIDIFSMQGKLLLSEKIRNNRIYRKNIGEYPAGIYLLRITSNNFNRNYKLVKF